MLHRMTLIVAAVLGGCSGIEVSHDYDPGQDFRALRTWAWAPVKPDSVSEISRVSTLSHERIQRAVANELTSRHFREVELVEADFWVRYHAAVGQRVEGEPNSSDGWYTSDLWVQDEGTLVVDVISVKDHRLVWRGAARTEIEFEMTPEEREARIQELVRRIFEQFPPKEKSGSP